MSAYSTLTVSRAEALAAYDRLVRREPTNSHLEAFLDGYLEESLLNVRISDSAAVSDDEATLRSYTQG